MPVILCFVVKILVFPDIKGLYTVFTDYRLCMYRQKMRMKNENVSNGMIRSWEIAVYMNVCHNAFTTLDL